METWLLALVGLAVGAGGYLIGRRSRTAPPRPAAPPPEGTPDPDAPELLGEGLTDPRRDLSARLPVVWDGSPEGAPPPAVHYSGSGTLLLTEELIERAQSLPTLPRGWKLVFVSGEKPCPDFPLERARLRVGRREGCEIRIPDSSVSKAHADLLLLEDGPAVIDLHSVNGTWVNGDPIPPGNPRPLKRGDRLAFSSFEFTVFCEGAVSR